MAETTVRIVLADDHPIVRNGIRAELETIPGVKVVGEASDGREAEEMVKLLTPDLVFMDISMRGLNGIDATRKIIQAFPSVKIVILSMHESEEYYWRALKSGASGYLLKKGATAELRIAVAQVMGGGIYLSRDISRRLVERLPQQMALSKNPLEQLSDRQREILQLIAEGQTTKEIASVLKVSPKTVEYHRAKLMERLRIFDIPGLVRFALEHKLIDLGDSAGC